MVLFKRKRVQYLTNPAIHEETEVWLIEETGELFTDYEEYLRRNDFYRQKRFICEATGLSGLTFREALVRELEASGALREVFPDTLREPILRKVQFSQFARIDQLVDWIHEEFKEDFYPGEQVAITIANERSNALIKEKVKFPELLRPDGSTERVAFARYFVEIDNDTRDVALFDQFHISRDRRLFSKQRLRSLLKDCIERESWSGAPWLVKPQFADRFRISTDIPQHLTQEHQVQARKLQALEQRVLNGTAVKLGRPKSSTKPPDKDLAARGSGHTPAYPVSQPPSHAPNGSEMKFPIEDLELCPSEPTVTRPTLKFLTLDAAATFDRVGALLETWNTLNVYCEVYELDSFTFDDYQEALQSHSPDRECELVAEIHCALLRTMVNDSGVPQITLPQTETREANSGSHRAAEMNIDWVTQLQKRELQDGRWVSILVGLLFSLSRDPRMESTCNYILAQLAPTDEEATWEVALQQYLVLDIRTRIDILQILCLRSLETKVIRAYLEECSNNMTEHRREKYELKRQWKSSLEELRELETERNTLQPEAQAEPVVEIPPESSDEDDRPVQSNAARRANLRAEVRKERAWEAPLKKLSKEEKRLEKVESKIQALEESIRELEEDIREIDNDLREADCPRTRVLGKDRFWNRYYWLERNGMPFAGLPNSSTARAGYANACVWVQGPDAPEREGFLELDAAEDEHYARAFGVTVHQRKSREEGKTSLMSAEQWAYYDQPEQLEGLIAWLDARGTRESRLRKDLLSLQEIITKHMQRRHAYLGASEDESISKNDIGQRSSVRIKTIHADSPLRCQAWHNTAAIHGHGHLLSEARSISTRKQRGVAAKKTAEEASPEPGLAAGRISRRSRGGRRSAAANGAGRQLRTLRHSL